MKDPFIERLERSFQQPLPGVEAQYRMAHVVRRRQVTPPADVRRAAVLALFYPRQGAWHLVLMERDASNPNDRHGGQISFPGGKFEPADGSLLQTALREAHEEVNAPTEGVRVLGPLTELYIPVSNYLVHPFVAWVDFTPRFVPQESEVKAILEVPFQTFLQPQSRSTVNLRIRPGLVLQNVPCFTLQGKIVWGATAMILSELLEVTERG